MSAKVTLEYNPYLKRIEILIDDAPLSKDSRLNLLRNEYLQHMLGAREHNGWKGLAVELAREINDDFELYFCGRAIDYDDIVEAFSDTKIDNLEIQLHHKEKTEEAIIIQKFDAVIKDLENGPFEALKDRKLKDKYDKAQETTFEVNVMATMSSGKSTVLNAMIGRELLPSKNEACTATVARITANPNNKNFVAECRDEFERVIVPKKDVTDKDLDSYNENENVYYIDLDGPIPSLQTNRMNLRLIDTPGPNNSRVKEHGEITNRIVNDLDTSMILYILNATQLGIADDHIFFSGIVQTISQKGKQAQDRVLFVLNKCDELDSEDGEGVEKVIANLKKSLKVQYGIDNAKIIPVTALNARIIRQIQCGESLTRNENGEITKFMSMCLGDDKYPPLESTHFEKYADLTPSCRKKVNDMFSKVRSKEEEALIHTGIPALELTIKEYLEKYAYPMKLKDMHEQYFAVLEGISQEKNLEKRVQENKRELINLQNNIKVLDDIISKGEGKEKLKQSIIAARLNLTNFKDIQQNRIYPLEEKLSDKYVRYSNEKIEVSRAESIINNFRNDIDNEMEKIISEMQMKSVALINHESEKLNQQFNDFINNVGLQINFDEMHYDISTALQMKTGNSGRYEQLLDDYVEFNTSLEDIMEKHVRTEQKAVPNPRKRWWTFWRPKTILTTVETVEYHKVGEKRLVDVFAVIQKALSKDYLPELTKAYNEQEEKLKNEFEKVKKYILSEKINELDNVLEAVKNDFLRFSIQQDKTQEEMNKLQTDLEWLHSNKKALQNIFEF